MPGGEVQLFLRLLVQFLLNRRQFVLLVRQILLFFSDLALQLRFLRQRLGIGGFIFFFLFIIGNGQRVDLLLDHFDLGFTLFKLSLSHRLAGSQRRLAD